MATGIKTGGRSKGTPNKNTTELREKFTLLLENNFNKLQTDIDLLEPKDRVKTLLDVAKFVVPTLKAIEVKNDENNPNFLPVIINLGQGTPPPTKEHIEISFKD
jgi:hypothetical protein